MGHSPGDRATMILIRALVTPFAIAAIVLCCFAAETVPVYLERTPIHVVGGYSVGRVPLGGLELFEPPYDPQDSEGLSYPIVVQPALVRVGWDEEFILAERHPLPRYTTMGDQPDSSHPEWYIVVLLTGEVHTSYSYDRFLDLRADLGVPDSIEMRDARKVYYGGWIPRYRQSD
jgi:hypothetical protein